MLQLSRGDTHLPKAEQLSLVLGAVLLTYALGPFIVFEPLELGVQLPGFYLGLQLRSEMLVAALAGGLAASGTDWLLSDHPAMRRSLRGEHWLLPALTAWVIGLPLAQMPVSPLRWLVFFVAGGVLVAVWLAEYIAVDPYDGRHPLAVAGLSAMAFALYLVLVAALRSVALRLFVLAPLLGLASGVVALRTLRLRLSPRWPFLEAALIAVIIGQLATALHYWPIGPVAYGLALLGPTYALTILLSNLAIGEPLRQAILEPAFLLALIWGIALWIGY